VAAGEPKVGENQAGAGKRGERIAGKYELKRLIGAGAMGSVYEGVHLDLGKRVAIKLLRPEFCASPEAVARFRREARAASAIESEHVAQIFDFGRDDALGLYMVIEYLEGEDLEARFARERTIDVLETATIGWQLARGLARAHAVGVIHRDLKPANLFLTKRDDRSPLAKILDFGISKLEAGKWAGSSGTCADGGAEPTLTEHGTTLGTPQYMSPEQCAGKAEIDGRTDVWSLCAVLYEALAGEPAISDADGYVGAMQRIVSTDICSLAKRAPWVPQALARVLDAGLVRDREARIRDAATLACRLIDACPEASGRAAIASVEHHADKASPAASDDAQPPSSEEDRLEMFMRTRELPVPIPKRRG
jgi:serine/threonine protein kinase